MIKIGHDLIGWFGQTLPGNQAILRDKAMSDLMLFYQYLFRALKFLSQQMRKRVQTNFVY